MTDDLHSWCKAREQVPWLEVRHGPGWPGTQISARHDGIIQRITSTDQARDPLRAQRMLAAYEQVRANVDTNQILDFGLLSTWQQTVLGVTHAPFRRKSAFAKAGRERYGLDPDTPARFELCLADSRDEKVPVASRAARAYLDVLFFHPFADGNARSALLACAFVLATKGIVLDQVGPLAQLQRPADDQDGAIALAELVINLIEGTRRRFDNSSRHTST